MSIKFNPEFDPAVGYLSLGSVEDPKLALAITTAVTEMAHKLGVMMGPDGLTEYALKLSTAVKAYISHATENCDCEACRKRKEIGTEAGTHAPPTLPPPGDVGHYI